MLGGGEEARERKNTVTQETHKLFKKNSKILLFCLEVLQQFCLHLLHSSIHMKVAYIPKMFQTL